MSNSFKLTHEINYNGFSIATNLFAEGKAVKTAIEVAQTTLQGDSAFAAGVIQLDYNHKANQLLQSANQMQQEAIQLLSNRQNLQLPPSRNAEFEIVPQQNYHSNIMAKS